MRQSCFLWTVVVLAFAITQNIIAAPPAGFSKVDQTVEIGVVGGTMRYDKTFFVVKPGSKIKLVFKNTDLMPHNLVICSPGEKVGMEVAQAAWRLGVNGLVKHYIPNDKRVLFATKLMQPTKNDELFFKAPATEADYPFVCTFPGHVFAMKGIMRVSNNLDQKAPAAAQTSTKGLPVSDEPYAYRTYVKGISTHVICVGTPQGMHFAFNPETCTIAQAWTGDFLDAKKDQGGRGGGGSKILGKVFYNGGKTFPIRIGSAAPKVIAYKGYRLSKDGYPTFLYDVDGIRVQHSVAPDSEGKRLSQWFDLNLKSAKAVYYVADAADKTDSLSGKLKDGKLRTASAKHVRFEVGVKP
jgi:azurin